MASRDVTRHPTAGGRVVYRLPLEVFPGFFGNAYLIAGGARPVLVDTGSGQGASNRDLEEAFGQVRDRFGDSIRFRDLGAIVITHGHIDHFGGLRHVRGRSDAPVLIHRLDHRIVSGYRKRLAVTSRHVEAFFESAGVSAEKRPLYMATYLRTKALFTSERVDEVFDSGTIVDGELEVIPVPGHCPGQVCVRVDDVLLTADHVLADITPHLSPESITRSTGMSHYLDSLDTVEGVGGIALGLGGHHGPIADVRARLDEIRVHHRGRLDEVLDHCREPRSIVELSRRLFGRVESYHVLLAVLEAGAHVEYLYDRGELVAENAESLGPDEPVVLYRRS
ncbi:MAG: MBL fold metallo-hydrolase [Acidobacteriota bacterium]